jgi:glycosyltransferase involved in cell wall biosynthesis
VPDPLITIGIPFYNAEKYLLNSIKSIFAQTFQEWELILVDDGSTDGSLKIAKSISDPRVRVISDGKNKKLPARLNQIIDLARGQYIARMDADDMCSPERLEKQLSLLKDNPAIDVVGTGFVCLDIDDIPIGKRPTYVMHEEICSTPHRVFGILHPSILARKSWYERNRYDESALLVEDFKLWLESYEKSRFQNVPDLLFYYRNVTSFSQKKLLIARLNLIKVLFEHYIRKNPVSAICYSGLQILKMIAGPIICLLKSERGLIQKRYVNISDREKDICTDILNYIKSTKVPMKSLNKD